MPTEVPKQPLYHLFLGEPPTEKPKKCQMLMCRDRFPPVLLSTSLRVSCKTHLWVSFYLHGGILLQGVTVWGWACRVLPPAGQAPYVFTTDLCCQTNQAFKFMVNSQRFFNSRSSGHHTLQEVAACFGRGASPALQDGQRR